MENHLTSLRRQMLALLFVALAGCATAGSVNAKWLLSYEGKSTNEAIWDARASATIDSLVPQRIAEDLKQRLNGPPDTVRRVGDGVVLSACLATSCGDKALLWVDTVNATAVAAIASCPELMADQTKTRWMRCSLILTSKFYSAGGIPAPARAAVIDWVSEHDVQVAKVDFLDLNGERRSLDVRSFAKP